MTKKKSKSDKTTYGKWEGLDVTEVALILTNTGDGLSKAQEIEPRSFRQGEKIYVVIESEVDKVRFDRIHDKDADEETEPDLRRVHIAQAQVVTLVDFDVVEEVIERQRAANEAWEAEQERKKQEAKGVHKLPDVGNEHIAGDPRPVAEAAKELLKEAFGDDVSEHQLPETDPS